ncbi:FtsB family cell division protein [Robertmurraya korlensis]|uniref:FtsB family cell division protein n=1 Tax=Robertmurraya korlensis TaxID=519977 RepID=UPI0008257768|nr:septum formation initiator family protein [Robertmurraya korlensis]
MSVVRKHNISKIPSQYVQHQEKAVIQNARKRTLLMRRLTVFIVIVGLAAYFIVSTLLRQSATLEAMKEEKQKADQELVALKKDETILKEEIVKLNDEEYIAKLARKDYFLSNSNEIIFNLPVEKKDKEK